MNTQLIRRCLTVVVVGAALLVSACESLDTLPTAPVVGDSSAQAPEYRVGSDDQLSIFVWRNPELTTTVTVRPDDRITIPLIEDLAATGKTPTALARDIEKQLKKYIQDPIVAVIVQHFVGPFADRIRIVGEAARPQALPYRSTMTLLDVMVAVGGLTEFADGNRATLTRNVGGKQITYRLLLGDLLRDGKMVANVKIMPGDVIVVPEAWF